MFGRSIRAMSRRTCRAWAPALVALVTLVASPPALEAVARAAGTESSEARATWEKGRTLVAKKKWDAAADAFRQADVMEPNPQYRLDLARALASAEKFREASEALDRIDADKGASAGVRSAANKLRERIGKRLGTIVITLSGGGSGAVIEIDGKRVKSGASTRVDPGTHKLRAHAAGWVPVEMTLEVEGGKTESVPFTLERDPSASAAADDAEPLPEEEGETEREPPTHDGGGTLLPAAIAWSVGAVGFGAGAIFGVFAFNEADKARDNCVDNRCTEEARDAIHTSKLNGGLSTVGFVVGGAGLVTGIVLAVVYGGGDPPEAQAGPVHVTPWVGSDAVGLRGAF